MRLPNICGVLLVMLTAAGCDAPTDPALTPEGLSAVKFGMSPTEAAKALGVPFTARQAREDEACWYSRPQEETGPGVTYMVVNGKIARIDVRAPSNVKSAQGIGVGASSEDIKKTYGDKVSVTPHKYAENGSYLEIVAPGANAGLLFEAVDGKIISFRAGALEPLRYVESCA